MADVECISAHAPQTGDEIRAGGWLEFFRMGTTLRGVHSHARWGALIFLAAGLLVTGLVAYSLKTSVDINTRQHFENECQEMQRKIADRLETNALLLSASAALFETADQPTRADWLAYMGSLGMEARLPGIQGTGYAELVSPAELEKHIEAVRADGLPDYTVIPPGEREIYAPVMYVYPAEGRNLQALGFDFLVEPLRSAAAEKARDQNDANLTGKVILVQENEQDLSPQAGILMFVPVYHRGVPHQTVAERRAAIRGWVYSAYRMHDLIESIVSDQNTGDMERPFQLQIYAGEQAEADALLYSDSFGTSSQAGALVEELVVDFGGQRWLLRFEQVPEVPWYSGYGLVWLALVGGSLISFLTFWLLLSLLGMRANALRIADDLTRELRGSEQRARATLQALPDLMFRLDRDGVFLDYKADISDLYNPTPDIIGKRNRDISPPEFGELIERQIAKTLETRAMQTFEYQLDLPARGPRDFEARMIASAENEVTAVVRDITERKQAELALRASEMVFRQVVHTTLEGFIALDTDGRIALVNPQMAGMLGYSQDELVGRSMESILDEAELEAHREQMRLRRQGFSRVYERLLRAKSGEPVWVNISASPKIDPEGNFTGSFGFITNISERKQIESNLRETNAYLENLINYANAPIIVWELPQFRITRFNHAFEALTGRNEADMQGQSLEVLFPPALAQASMDLIRRTETGERWETVEIVIQHLDGSARTVLWNSATIFRPDGVTPVATIAQGQDITERKQAEMALRDANESLEQRVQERTQELRAANLELEKAARMKNEFLASMSHELRTPLTGILGLSDALQLQSYGPLSEKQIAALRNINASGQKLLDLINGLLDISRIEAGMFDLYLGSCSLPEVCQACLVSQEEMLKARKQQYQLVIIPDVIHVQADMRRLKQMINHLLSNAIKFTPHGGQLGIEVVGSPAEQLVRITVWDSGIGIQPVNLPRLFKPFVQLDASLERRYSGMGLGLALVRRLAELHGGSVSAESTPNHGSRFTLSLPWQPEKELVTW